MPNNLVVTPSGRTPSTGVLTAEAPLSIKSTFTYTVTRQIDAGLNSLLEINRPAPSVPTHGGRGGYGGRDDRDRGRDRDRDRYARDAPAEKPVYASALEAGMARYPSNHLSNAITTILMAYWQATKGSLPLISIFFRPSTWVVRCDGTGCDGEEKMVEKPCWKEGGTV